MLCCSQSLLYIAVIIVVAIHFFSKGGVKLLQAVDRQKDQTYFLSLVSQVSKYVYHGTHTSMTHKDFWLM